MEKWRTKQRDAWRQVKKKKMKVDYGSRGKETTIEGILRGEQEKEARERRRE